MHVSIGVVSTVWQELVVVLAWFLFLAWTQRLILRTGSRELIHLIVGLTIIPLVFWIQHWFVAAIPTIVILSANAGANKIRLDPARPSIIRIYPFFAVVVPAFFLLFFWNKHRIDVIAQSVLLMTFGDAAASFVGKRFGSGRIRWTGKSLQGLLAFILASLLTLLLSDWFLFHNPVSIAKLLSVSLICGVVELVVPGAWDNPAVLTISALLLGFAF